MKILQFTTTLIVSCLFTASLAFSAQWTFIPRGSIQAEYTDNIFLSSINEEDDVIAVDEGYIELLLPRQFFAIGDHVFVDEGETVGRMDVLTRPSHFQPAIPKPLLTADNVSIISDTLSTVVRGEINNPYQVALDNVRVTAIVYDDQGQLIGGGFDWIETIPPAGLMPVEVWVSAGKTSASAELFAGIDEIIRE